jgi:thiamine-phosphate pyrophosphorylase
MRADAVLLSPAFATRSHPDARALGPVRFRLLAQHARMPVIALGGMTARTARRLASPRWAAIDGLS